MNGREINRLRGPVLRSVSRSFYLSLRVLPRPLRDPLSLAYLLARAADTIADTPEPPVEIRAEALRNLAGTIQGTLPRETAVGVRNAFAPLQNNDAERALIEALAAILAWLDLLEEADRLEVRAVLEKINRGQTQDLERFGPSTSTSIKALAAAGELDEYTYLVAGCVGEFWTRICFAHLPDFSERTESEMLALGVQYGKGLQLINILRDAGSDLRQGRCYLPAEELHALGLTPEKLLRDPAPAETIMQPWLEKAESGLDAGIEYACAIRAGRVRFATVLPAIIGRRTLVLLREAGPAALERRVKVPRNEIRRMVLATAISRASPSMLRCR